MVGKERDQEALSCMYVSFLYMHIIYFICRNSEGVYVIAEYLDCIMVYSAVKAVLYTTIRLIITNDLCQYYSTMLDGFLRFLRLGN